jgi:uncharacterized membrane protein
MTAQETTIVAIFADSTAARDAIAALKQAGFHDKQIGFARRHEGARTIVKQHGPNAILRGIVGGIMGVADILLVPVVGPGDATSILSSVLPAAEEAIDDLPYPGKQQQKQGLPPADTPSADAAQATTESDSTPTSDSSDEKHYQEGSNRETRTGAVTGGVVGGVLGAAAALLIPEIGPAVAGGVLAGALGGAAIGGVSGSFLGTFTHLGIPEEKAHNYEQAIKAGNTLLTVTTRENTEQAVEILRQHNAQKVETY